MSTAEWSAEAASQVPDMYKPIYAAQGPGGAEVSMPMPQEKQGKGKALPGDKKNKAQAQQYRMPGERAFPMGLLMAVIVVTALIIGLGIYVVSMMFGAGSNPPKTDTTPPEITSIAGTFTSDTAAEITWVTDKPATGQVMLCDPAGVCSWSEPDKTLTKNHKILVMDLKKGVDYHLTVKSVDADGNEKTVEKDHIFGTSPASNPSDTTPPVISGVSFNSKSDISITITWTTNEASIGQIEYGSSQSYGSLTAEEKSYKTSHSVLISGLSPDTIYYFQVISKDENGNKATWNQLSSDMNPFKTATSVQIGAKVDYRAPEFSLQDTNGGTVKLSDLRGKIVMVNFWFKDCAPCIAEMPYIQDAYKDWIGNSNNKPLVILALDSYDTMAIMQQFAAGAGYTFTMLRDPQAGISTLYPTPDNKYTCPRTFFLNGDGIIKLIKHGSGFSSKDEIINILKTL
jgi:peroxiredoxin